MKRRKIHRRKAHWRAHQATPVEEIHGPGRAGQAHGLSASFLSQLETGRVVPTLRNLARIAMVFSKDLSYFFESEPQAMFRVHRRKERYACPDRRRRADYFLKASLTWCPTGTWTPTSPVHPARKGSRARAHMHAGFEFLYVLEGELDLRHVEKSVHAEPGDAVYFDASTPHSYVCAGKKPPMFFIVTCISHRRLRLLRCSARACRALPGNFGSHRTGQPQ